VALCDPATHRFERVRAVLRERRIKGALRGHLRSGALDVSNVSVTCEHEVDLLLGDESGIEVGIGIQRKLVSASSEVVGVVSSFVLAVERAGRCRRDPSAVRVPACS